MLIVLNLLKLLSLILIGIGYQESKTRDDKLRFTLLLIPIIILGVLINFIISYWNSNDIGSLSGGSITSISQFDILLCLPIIQGPIALIAIFFCAWKKKGFANL